VPAFIINEQYLISGAQDSGVFVDAFQRIEEKVA
jgi:predicted DsbA family dithiol-disulfide isomerase